MTCSSKNLGGYCTIVRIVGTRLQRIMTNGFRHSAGCIASQEIYLCLGMKWSRPHWKFQSVEIIFSQPKSVPNPSLKIFTVAKSEVAMRNKVIPVGRGCGSFQGRMFTSRVQRQPEINGSDLWISMMYNRHQLRIRANSAHIRF